MPFINVPRPIFFAMPEWYCIEMGLLFTWHLKTEIANLLRQIFEGFTFKISDTVLWEQESHDGHQHQKDMNWMAPMSKSQVGRLWHPA